MSAARPYDYRSDDSPELILFRDTVARFVTDEIEPYYEQWDKQGRVPRELFKKAGEAGLLSADLPVEYGGSGVTVEFAMAVADEFARRGYLALASMFNVSADIVAFYIYNLGSEEQKRSLLPKMAAGELIGAIAMTEPGAGSDLQGIKTTALPVNGGESYAINGSKTFISNGQNCDFVIVATKTDPRAGAKGTTLFIVDAALPGFKRGRNLEKIGQHAADTSELFFDNVIVPASAVLGRVGNGFGHLVDELPRERLCLAVGGVAHARGALEKTVEYVSSRKAFGTTVASFQHTRFELARLKTEVEVHQAFADKCMRLYREKRLDATTAAMAKFAISDMECRVIDTCLQMFGGYGYMAEYPISRYYVDARIQRIYGGTNEIMKEVIARSLVGRA
ncbi:MAG: acyl-CoA dehydrogenase family protein [Nevskia sp.]|nr:acyl-CoA dehydrogenase family protein [Nevskia sp.]